MKSTRDKKKSLTKDRGSSNIYIGPNGPVEIINGRHYTLPKGFKASCHLHHNPRLFKTMDELQEHVKKYHRVWKG